MHSACRWCRSCGETEDEGSDIVVGAGGGRDDFFGGGRGELWGKRVRVGEALGELTVGDWDGRCCFGVWRRLQLAIGTRQREKHLELDPGR